MWPTTETPRKSCVCGPRQGPEYDVLRSRHFKIYEKTAGMFLVYKALWQEKE